MNHIFTKLFYSFLLILFAFSLNAQSDKNPVKEFGIGLSGLDNFSLQYRWGTDQKLNRITGGFGFSLASGSTSSLAVNSVNLSGTYSILKLKAINEKFGFLIGPSAGIRISRSTSFYNSSSESTTTNLGPRIGIVLGAYFKVNEAFYIYGDINPHLYYTFSKISGNTNRDQNSFGISGLTNSGAMITLAYRFQEGTK